MDDMGITHVAVIRHPHLEAYEISVARKSDGCTSVLSSIEMSVIEPGVFDIPLSPLLLDKRVAQQLADDLWNAGIRPIGGGSIGALQQAESHITSLKAQADGLNAIISELLKSNG